MKRLSYTIWTIPFATSTPRILAAVDIGTNTILMVSVRWQNDQFTLLCDHHRIARLGEGLQERGIITQSAVQRAVAILKDYRQWCTFHHCDALAAVATSAMRRATNQQEILQQLSDVLQIPITIISGADEAKLTYLGSVEPEHFSSRSTVLDIGGGSTEIASGTGWQVEDWISLEIGAVRLTERFFPLLPPSPRQIQEAQNHIRHHLRQIPWTQFGTVFCVGGTPTTLAALILQLPQFDPTVVHGAPLTIDQLDPLLEWLLTQPLPTLKAHPLIHPDRADILPMGGLILREFLNLYHPTVALTSARGLRFGVLLDLAQRLQHSGSHSLTRIE